MIQLAPELHVLEPVRGVLQKYSRSRSVVIGMRIHSGWGALVTVSGDAANIEVLDRRRIIVADPNTAGAIQPYHFASTLEIPDAKRYLSNCADVSQRLAFAAIDGLVQELHSRECRVVGGAVLLASGRLLPNLPGILASHPLIHTAEGEFFRIVFWRACQQLDLSVTGIRERDLDGCANAVFGKVSGQMWRRISALKSSLGPPWTEDQKKASLAASIVLVGSERGVRLPEETPSLDLI